MDENIGKRQEELDSAVEMFSPLEMTKTYRDGVKDGFAAGFREGSALANQLEGSFEALVITKFTFKRRGHFEYEYGRLIKTETPDGKANE